MQVKIWLIALPFMCLTGGALAQSAPAPAEPAAPAEKAAPPAKPAKPHARQRQGGDIRACLDKKDNKAIIRCSEQGRKPVHKQARRHAPAAQATPTVEPVAKPAPKP